jgi:hypothetical protein
VWRHLEATKLQKAQSAARAVGAVELVDAELGAVGVAGDVGEQMAQGAVGDPRLAEGWSGAPRDVDEAEPPVRRAISANAISSWYKDSARPSSTRGACEVVPMNRPAKR